MLHCKRDVHLSSALIAALAKHACSYRQRSSSAQPLSRLLMLYLLAAMLTLKSVHSTGMAACVWSSGPGHLASPHCHCHACRDREREE